MTAKTERSGPGAILYDDALLDHADQAVFEPSASAAGTAGGRGAAWVLKRGGGEEWVLRHYRRGGLMAHVSSDLYLWTGLESSRAWREWRLLDALYKDGLPVPRPVAARVRRLGPWYRADLITRRLPDSHSVAEHLRGGLRRIPWNAIGMCIRRFHDAGVYHADLNAHNVLLGPKGEVYLIDFDKGARRQGDAWKRANLHRLRRSLDKLSAGAFDEECWTLLQAGYAGR